VILTAAIQTLGGRVKAEMCRQPEIVADAACAILKRHAGKHTGNFYIDEDVLVSEGVTDFTHYAVQPGSPLLHDLFLDT
jgi:citronellol/citronellal dehydrogenase